MTQNVYATSEQYEAFAEEPFDGTPQKLTARLSRASEEVDRLVRFAVFDTDVDGKPTDPKVLSAFERMTCAVVEFWESTDDPEGVGMTSAGAVKIGTVSLGASASAATSTAAVADVDKLGARVFSIAQGAGLLPVVYF